MRSFHEGLAFESLLLEDPDVMGVLTPAEVRRAFDLGHQLRNVQGVIDRVFGAAPEEA
jgi:hypothetical protein